jgi:hypothetical protein
LLAEVGNVVSTLEVEVESKEDKERHVFRSLLKFAVIAALIALAVRMAAEKKKEFSGLTETEARVKLEEKLSPRLGEETAADVAETVVEKLRGRGILAEDPIAEAVDEVVEDLTDSVEKSELD